MTVKEIENEIEYLQRVRMLEVMSIEFWGKKLAATNQKIYNLEINLLFENAKETNLKTAIDGTNK